MSSKNRYFAVETSPRCGEDIFLLITLPLESETSPRCGEDQGADGHKKPVLETSPRCGEDL